MDQLYDVERTETSFGRRPRDDLIGDGLPRRRTDLYPNDSPENGSSPLPVEDSYKVVETEGTVFGAQGEVLRLPEHEWE